MESETYQQCQGVCLEALPYVVCMCIKKSHSGETSCHILELLLRTETVIVKLLLQLQSTGPRCFPFHDQITYMTPAGVQQQRSPKVKPVLHTVKQLKWYKALHWSCFSESDNLKPCVYLVDYRPNHCAENWTFFVGEHYKSWSLVGLFLTAQNSIDLWLRLVKNAKVSSLYFFTKQISFFHT